MDRDKVYWRRNTTHTQFLPAGLAGQKTVVYGRGHNGVRMGRAEGNSRAQHQRRENVGHLARRGGHLVLTMALVVGALAIAASSATAGTSSSAAYAAAKRHFHFRVGNGLGLIPPLILQRGHSTQGLSAATYSGLTYHGGVTMTGGVTVHAIFWAAPGYHFLPAPPGSLSYEDMISQYFTDIAAASTGTSGGSCTLASCNAFTVEPQYASGTSSGAITSGDNTISFNKATDVVTDSDHYPTRECTSPANARVCITDTQVRAEVDHVIQSTGGQRGLHDIWYVFLPPNVDECLIPFGVCASNQFLGYHSFSNVKQHGVTIYAVGPDPIIESGQTYPGGDPQGNPDAELAVDVSAHELNEAMTDPEGAGWLDPLGGEVGDKCEIGPQHGTPLGYAPNGSPYNQVVHHDDYLIQMMWSNDNQGCVQATTQTKSPLPLPQVSLRQFSSQVSGNTENNTAGIKVTVRLVRAGGPAVASGRTTTASNGSWSVTLSGPHVVGDDRDTITVTYSGPGAPHNDLIQTGFGTWTGWTRLDTGTALTNHDPRLNGPSLIISPCLQVGQLSYSGASGPGPNTGFCNAESVADIPLSAPVAAAQAVTFSSVDNRAAIPEGTPEHPLPGANFNGALIRLTVPVAEPGPPVFSGGLFGFSGAGIPTCTADLTKQTLSCTGLVDGETYTLTHYSASGSPDVTHVVSHGGGLLEHTAIRGGDKFIVANSARTLTALHVARFRVQIAGNGGVITKGTCTPGEYWGGPQQPPPGYYGSGSGSGSGAIVTSPASGELCPLSGQAAGLSGSSLGQTDEFSGGLTLAELDKVSRTAPLNGETMYGSFTAHATASGGGRPEVDLSIERAHKVVLKLGNADTVRGVRVKGLTPGNYRAVWTVKDANGDTRVITTQFTEHRLRSHHP